MTIASKNAELRLNICGRQYAINEATIKLKLHGSLFSTLYRRDNTNTETEADDGYISYGCIRLGDCEYYIERTPSLFELVLQYAYTGKLHCPSGVCESMLLDEVRFWRLPETVPEECCRVVSRVEERQEESEDADDEEPPAPRVRSLAEKSNSIVSASRRHGVMTKYRSGRKFQDTIWRLFEYPESSWGAKIVNALCVFFIFLSIFNLIISTVPSLQHCTGHEFLGLDVAEAKLHGDFNTTMNYTLVNGTDGNLTYATFADEVAVISDPKNNNATASPPPTNVQTCDGGYIFDLVEAVCVAWFTVELLLRFICSPDKMLFLKGALNWIDLLSTLPFYVEVIVWAIDATNYSSVLMQFLRFMRVLRVLRIFRLARYFESLQVMGETLWNSRAELGLLILFLAVSTIIFSTLLFYIEKDVNNTGFTSIPAAFWWCIVTLTTTGYGDVTPQTTLGKTAAGCACIVGVLILAFPVSILVEKFRARYEDKNRVLLKKVIRFVHSTQEFQKNRRR